MRSYDRIFVDLMFFLSIIDIRGDELNNQANASDISDFLECAKKLIAEGKFDFVPRRKNMQSLAAHGLTILDAKTEIFELVVGNYYRGPKRDLDPDRPGDIWEFKKNIGGIPFYVKLKIVQENKKDALKCLGFHEDEFA